MSIFTSAKRLERNSPCKNTAKYQNKLSMGNTIERGSREVVTIDAAEQRQLKKALSLYGAITRMMREAEISRTAIVNMRDLGRAERTTVEKVREYLSAQNSGVSLQTR